jgi:hypothetical protein
VKISVIRGQTKTQFAGTANIVHPREKAHAAATGFLTSHLELHTSAQRPFNPIQATLEHFAPLRLCARIIFSLFVAGLAGSSKREMGVAL